MLIPITRQKFEQLVPIVATGSQYKYCWGKFSDFLIRVLISMVSAFLLYFTRILLPDEYAPIIILIAIITSLYWLWGPIFWASLRNWKCRQYRYSGFWRGEVIDLYISEEIIGKEQTVNNKGQLVIVENREKRLNLEVGDETGFSTRLQVPLKRAHQAIAPGEIAEMLIMSNRPDLARIAQVTDIYLPELDLWVSDYPYLRRDEFVDIGSRLENEAEERETPRKKRPQSEATTRSAKTRRTPRRQDDW